MTEAQGIEIITLLTNLLQLVAVGIGAVLSLLVASIWKF